MNKAVASFSQAPTIGAWSGNKLNSSVDEKRLRFY